MPKNPLETNPEREQRVRERAYHLWESEGKPHGRDVEFWERARALIATEESAGAGRPPGPKQQSKSAQAMGVEEAVVQENRGEFRNRSADPVEAQPASSPKRRTSRRREKKPG